MAYKIIGEDGNVRQHKGKEMLASDIVLEKTILDEDRRIVRVVSSSDRQDRDGDRITQEGIDHQFAKSVLYAHDYGYSFLPIGKILSAKMEKREDYKVTVEEHQINPPGAYEISDAAWKLIAFGALNATSIGFIPKIITRVESDAERQEMDLGRWGVLFEAIEKLETSWVPVQSNRDAIREAYGKGIIKPSEKQILFPKSWETINRPEHWAVGIDLEEKSPDTDQSDDVLEDLEITESQEEIDSDEKRLDIEKRLDVLDGMIKRLTEQIEDIYKEPEDAPSAESEAQSEKDNQLETLSLSDEQVAEIARSAADIAAERIAKKLSGVVENQIKYHLGIVE